MRGVAVVIVTLVGCGRLGFDAVSGGSLVGDGPDGEIGDGPAPGCFTQLSASEEFACALLGDGGVWCWGRGNVGQLGNGRFDATAPPARVLDGPYTQLAAGRQHTCALRVDRGVECWGSGTNRALGQAASTDQAVPIVVAGLTADEVISAGAHSCARLGAQGSCWGDGDGGQLGDGTQPDFRAMPGPILVTSTQLWLGDDDGCAWTPTGLRCWGINAAGQLGVPPATTTGLCKDSADVTNQPCSPTGVTVPMFATVAQLSLARTHSCALDGAGGIWCWGDNAAGELGDATLVARSNPVQVALAPARQVVALHETTCALLVDGTVSCWGEGNNGELGDGGTTDKRPLPAAVPGLAGVEQLSAASDGSTICALTATDVRCWGRNAYGVVGDTGGADVLVPTSVIARCR